MTSHVVIIEGNISAGKSTLTADLKELLGYRVFLEPTLTNPYLEDFYKDPPRFAFKMQLWLLRQRFRMYVAAIRHVIETGQGVILDRSVYSDWVFAEKNRKDGNISAEGYDYYMRLRTQMLESLPVASVTLYLHVRPEVCYDRVHKMRGRDCESGIPLDYLKGLDEVYNMFVNEMRSKGSNVMHIDWDEFGDSQEIAKRVRAAPTRDALLATPAALKLLGSASEVRARQELAHEEYDAWYTHELANNWHADEHVDAENAADAARTQDKQSNATAAEPAKRKEKEVSAAATLLDKENATQQVLSV